MTVIADFGLSRKLCLNDIDISPVEFPGRATHEYGDGGNATPVDPEKNQQGRLQSVTC